MTTTQLRKFSFVALMVLSGIALLAYAGGAFRKPGPPKLEYERAIDLGRRERGAIVSVPFTLRNSGSSELTVRDFRTSCGCAAVEVVEDGVPVRIETLHLPPKSRAELSVRLAVGGRIGEPQTVAVQFSSNDPEREFGLIEIAVPMITGGLFSKPTAVVFGSVPIGEPSAKYLDLFDTTSPARRIERVLNLQPEHFEVELSAPLERDQLDSAPVARLKITAKTHRKGPLDGSIQIVLAENDSSPTTIDVTGKVVAPVESWPEAIVLAPPIVFGGDFAGESLLRSRDETPLEVRIVSAMDSVRAELRAVDGRPHQRLLAVKVPSDRKAHSVELRYRKSDGSEESLVIPLRYSENNP